MMPKQSLLEGGLPLRLLYFFAFVASAAAAAACTSDLSCSLNGVCDTSSGVCACDSPWVGASCEQLAFAVTPASAKNIYLTSDPRNTWSGPIVADASGVFHAFVPLYPVGSLGKVLSTLHGTASVITGPYDWTTLPQLPIPSINPAYLSWAGASGATVHSLWAGGKVFTASSLNGPFTAVAGFTYPGGNPAPIYHNGVFYMTNQFTLQIFTTPSVAAGSRWEVYANISHAALPSDDYHVEDPRLWVDARGNWHVINHAYSNVEFEHCASSAASAHWFSVDGREWTFSPQPYGHTVSYDDGSEHTYVTLERPYLHVDASGRITHIILAADIVTGDEGCANRTSHAHNGKVPCDNCKVSGASKQGPQCSAHAPLPPLTSLASLSACSGTTTRGRPLLRWVREVVWLCVEGGQRVRVSRCGGQGCAPAPAGPGSRCRR